MRSFRLFAALLLLTASLAPHALAHARMLRSEPTKGAVVAAAPTRLDLWFNELLEDGFHVVTVFPADQLAQKKRTDLTRGKPTVDRGDRTRLSVNLAELAPGEYVAEWRVLSRDGHSAPGRITFTVRAR